MKTMSKRFRTLLGGGLILLFSLVAISYAGAQTCVQPPSGLVSWWPGDGNADDIQNGNDGTLQNGATFAAGMVGQAFSFDGVDDYVDLGNWFNLQTFTIDLWVKAGASQVAFADIIDNNHNDFRSWVVQYDNVGSQYHWGAATGGSCCVGFALTPGVWQHLAITRDPNHVSRVYLDGALVGSAAGAGPIAYDGTQFLRLARWGGGGRNWDGQLDEVEIYNRALSEKEIKAIFDAGSVGKCKVIVVIDIKPGEFPNDINPRSRGRIDVAILTTDATDNTTAFDATTVDPDTVRFGRTGTEAAPVQDTPEDVDVDGDGDIDRVLQFNTQATGILCGDTSATLTGQTFDGQTIHGTDSIQTVGCK
ncbi:MAG: LamG domain-containing protein [Pseudomonadota bacterium]|nr:LamG domain-containing protein [Pseudomonadota bacterium]